jgi:hypothetical protein
MRITTPFVSTANPLGAVLAWLATGLLSVATLVLCPYNGAEAHGIAGNRLFLGTLTFDDPAVNDEFSSAFSDLRRSAPEGTAVDKALSVGLSRLLTPRLAFATGSTWIDRNTQATSNTRGFDTTSLALKGLLYENDPHETLLSAAFGWGLPGVGSRPLGAHGSIEPGIFFGKGFGDLPYSLSWLRPFAISGALGFEHPTGRGPGSNVFHWGAALQFSTFYLTDRFTGGPPKEEPLFQWVPLIELSADTPTTGKTSATAGVGIAYVGRTYQIAAEVLVPLNREAGLNASVIVSVLLFLDDLVPSVFGKPLLWE